MRSARRPFWSAPPRRRRKLVGAAAVLAIAAVSHAVAVGVIAATRRAPITVTPPPVAAIGTPITATFAAGFGTDSSRLAEDQSGAPLIRRARFAFWRQAESAARQASRRPSPAR